MSPFGLTYGFISFFNNNSDSYLNERASYGGNGVIPVVTLNSSALVTSGTGTLADPYIIGN